MTNQDFSKMFKIHPEFNLSKVQKGGLLLEILSATELKGQKYSQGTMTVGFQPLLLEMLRTLVFYKKIRSKLAERCPPII